MTMIRPAAAVVSALPHDGMTRTRDGTARIAVPRLSNGGRTAPETRTGGPLTNMPVAGS